MLKFATVVLTAVCFILPAQFPALAHPADGDSTAALRDSLRDLSRKVDILTGEFESMRLGEVARSTGDTTRGGLGPAGGKIYTSSKEGVSIAGYGEMVYEDFSSERSDGTPSGKTDRIDFLRAVVYFGYRYNDWILFNSEIEFEHASTGKEGEVSVEFAFVELAPAPYAKIRAGMMLVPVGIVNEKHEPTTFFGTLRPLVEQVIIPTTWSATGAGVYGTVGQGLRYSAYFLEGLNAAGYTAASGLREGRQGGSKAIAEDFGVAGRLEYGGFPGTLIGGSVFAGPSGQGAVDSLGTITANTVVVSGHAEFAWRGIEIRGLFAYTIVEDAGRLSIMNGETIGSRMRGWYVSGGYDIMTLIRPSSGHYLAPFAQYEQFNTQDRVADGFTADPANDRSVLTLGLVYKPHPNVAIKGDFRDNRNKAGTAVDQWNIAVAYLF